MNDIPTIDISDIEVDPEDIIIAFVDCLICHEFEEKYLDDAFELDDIILQVYDQNKLIIDCGFVDDDTYVTIPGDRLQYYNTNCAINIITEFKDLCKDYK
jgi:hypothetical protein